MSIKLSPIAVWSNRRLVEILGLAFVMVVVGITVTNSVLNYERTRQDLELRARAYSFSMATDVHWYLEVARQALTRTADSLKFGTEPNNLIIPAEMLGDLPNGVAVVIYDRDGNSVASNIENSHPINIADRPYFHLLAERTWTISNLIADRVTGNMTFALGRSLRRDGQLAGAVVAYAPMSVFSDAWLGAGGQDANAFLVHDNAWITARLPPIDSVVYDTHVPREFVDSFKGSGGSYVAAASPIDGVERILGYSRVASSPLVAVVGLGIDEHMWPFWHQTLVTSGILAAILVGLTMSVVWIRNLLAEREAAADHLQLALQRNESLLMEIHHRVKNNLQSVASLVRRRIDDSDAKAELDLRINAMSAVHEHLYNHGEFASADARCYLEELSNKVLSSTSSSHRVVIDVAPIKLPAKTLMPIGQIVTEAVINATKYGYPDDRRGTIIVSLSLPDPSAAILRVHNDGQPLADDRGAGLGSRLMKAFARQLNGDVSTRSGPDGVTVQVDFPTAQS